MFLHSLSIFERLQSQDSDVGKIIYLALWSKCSWFARIVSMVLHCPICTTVVYRYIMVNFELFRYLVVIYRGGVGHWETMLRYDVTSLTSSLKGWAHIPNYSCHVWIHEQAIVLSICLGIPHQLNKVQLWWFALKNPSISIRQWFEWQVDEHIFFVVRMKNVNNLWVVTRSTFYEHDLSQIRV